MNIVRKAHCARGRQRERYMATEFSEQSHEERQLARRLAVEKAITEISSRLIGTTDTDATIDFALERIGSLSGASRAYLFLFRDEEGKIDNTHEWCAEGVSRQLENLQGLPMASFPWWMSRIREGSSLTIHDVSALPEVAASERAILESQGIKSLIVMPVHLAGKVMGFLGFDDVADTGPWKEADLALLRLSAELIGGALTRRQTEFALRQSEARYRRLVEGLQGIVYTFSVESGATYWSPQVRDILGFEPTELEAKPFLWHDSIHPQDLARVDQAIEDFGAGKALEVEYRIRDADGGWHWFLDRSVGRQEAGAELMIEGIAIDITDRKRAEEALFAEKERVEVTLHSLGEAVITTDAAGLTEYLNPVAESLTGWSVAEAQGQPLDRVCRIISEDTREPVEDLVAYRVPDGKAVQWPHQILLVSREGREFAIEYSAAPMRDAGGDFAGVVLVLKDVTEARRLSREISYHASHDGLTGLINRREFEHRLARVLDTARVEKTDNALCYLDLDQFKLVNDTCGHVAGDEFLRQVAQLLQSHVRQRDTLARLGGDEFGLLMERCSLGEALGVAQKLSSAVAEHRFVWEDKSFSIGVSIGLVCVDETAADMPALLSAADSACYVAKDLGRNRIHVHQEDDEALATRHGEMQWAARLPRALDEDRFQLYFQPIISVAGNMGEVQHFELLLRMLDETGQVVLPSVFLPAAERYSLSGRLDRWVVATAFRWLSHHQAQLLRPFICSINLSGRSLDDEGFLEYVKAQFKQWRISHANICFEITETVAITNLSDAKILIQSLKALGCRFALDDFGSGLSSFAYLKNLAVDFLKIDGVFVKDMLRDPMDMAMVKSINEIGHVMGKRTIAEFVENEAILEKLRAIGVDYAQGYAIGRPQPIDSMLAP